MECEIARVNSNDEEIKEILSNVKNIAIIGLSPNEEKASHRVAKYLQSVGYKIFPVYPKEETILGEKVYRALADIPEKVDMVDIFRKPAIVMSVVEKAIERGDVDVIWTQVGIVNNEAGEKAVANGMKVVQNKCSMVEHKELF
jgi:predicted CoA-binding protein